MEKSDEKKAVKNTDKRRYLLRAFYLAILFFIVACIWYKSDSIKLFIEDRFAAKNNEQTEHSLSSSDFVSELREKADKTTVASLQNQITDMQTILNRVLVNANSSANIAGIEQNVADLRELIISSVNSKADIQSLVGLINRIDNLETEIDRLSRINNQGSVLLAAAMAVKESALDGRDFSFEAMVLDELNANNPKINDAVETIKKLSQARIYNNAELSEQFSEIYQSLTAQNKKDKFKDWKDRFVSKVKELVSIKATEETPENGHLAFLNALKNLTDKHMFSQAVTLINNDQNPELKALVSVQKWLENVENKKSFDAAISQISTYSLVLIKLNNVVVRE